MSETLFAPETREVPLKKHKPLVMRGLTLFDIAPLVRKHAQDFNAIRTYYRDRGENLSVVMQDVEQLARFLILDAPGILVDVLVACDMSQQLDERTAPMLPMIVQVMAIKAVIELSCEDIGGPKEFLSLMVRTVQNVVPGLVAEDKKASKIMPVEIFYPTRED